MIIAFVSIVFVLLIWKAKTIWEYFKAASRSDKYNIAVYAVISIGSLILLVLSSFGKADPNTIQSLILLTITSVTVALLLDRVGVLNEINTKLKGATAFRTRTEIENDYPLHEMWKDATVIKVVTMGGSVFFVGRLKDNVDKALKDGADFTFVHIKQGSTSWNEHFDNKMVNKTEENKIACISVAKTLTESYKDQIHYYQTEVNLPYALMYVEKKKGSFVKVDLYSIDVPDGERPCMLIHTGEPHYDFFKNQIETIIGKSNKIQ